MDINERFIKIGKLPFADELNLGDSVQVLVVGHEQSYGLRCVKVEHNDNQDGSENITYVLKYDPAL